MDRRQNIPETRSRRFPSIRRFSHGPEVRVPESYSGTGFTDTVHAYQLSSAWGASARSHPCPNPPLQDSSIHDTPARCHSAPPRPPGSAELPSPPPLSRLQTPLLPIQEIFSSPGRTMVRMVAGDGWIHCWLIPIRLLDMDLFDGPLFCHATQKPHPRTRTLLTYSVSTKHGRWGVM